MEGSVSNHINKLGYWSSIIFTFTGILYAVSMGVLLSKYTIPNYVNLEQYLLAVDKRFIDFYSFSQVFAFLSSLLFIVIVCTIHECVDHSSKIFSRVSICFGIGFMLLSCINYFVQFSIVRLTISNGSTQNLENFIQFNPKSFMFAINMLGWSLFLGLSCLFLGIIFKGKGINLGIRVSMYSTGMFCLIGFVGFVLDNKFFLFIFQIGMTIGLTTSAILLSIVFKKRLRE
ncbi:hypothetical protein ACLM5H_16585 [Fredinandcohnia humi]